MSDPFCITGPAVISFSGGRTSGYMLHRIMKAHGGALPDDVAVVFANTGREMPATLDFVQECATRWDVSIRWVEYRYRDGQHGFEEVNHNSASRNGEPFEQVIQHRKALPNPRARYCTAEMKIRTMKRFVAAEYGWRRPAQVVGLRADEPGRVAKATDPEGWKRQGTGPVLCPLAVADVCEGEVLGFWAVQDFDLKLTGSWEGNCDGCFLKSRGRLTRMFQDHPDRMAWWVEQERLAAGRAGVGRSGAFFRDDREPLAELADTVRRQGTLPHSIFDDRMECQWACTD